MLQKSLFFLTSSLHVKIACYVWMTESFFQVIKEKILPFVTGNKCEENKREK